MTPFEQLAVQAGTWRDFGVVSNLAAVAALFGSLIVASVSERR